VTDGGCGAFTVGSEVLGGKGCLHWIGNGNALDHTNYFPPSCTTFARLAVTFWQVSVPQNLWDYMQYWCYFGLDTNSRRIVEAVSYRRCYTVLWASRIANVIVFLQFLSLRALIVPKVGHGIRLSYPSVLGMVNKSLLFNQERSWCFSCLFNRMFTEGVFWWYQRFRGRDYQRRNM
jgi:hypothetical protein